MTTIPLNWLNIACFVFDRIAHNFSFAMESATRVQYSSFVNPRGTPIMANIRWQILFGCSLHLCQRSGIIFTCGQRHSRNQWLISVALILSLAVRHCDFTFRMLFLPVTFTIDNRKSWNSSTCRLKLSTWICKDSINTSLSVTVEMVDMLWLVDVMLASNLVNDNINNLVSYAICWIINATHRCVWI